MCQVFGIYFMLVLGHRHRVYPGTRRAVPHIRDDGAPYAGVVSGMIEDRTDAGRRLAEKMREMDLQDPIVLAIPRGGVVVGDEIARTLGCSMDVVMSKKITPPDAPEYAIGAITGDGTIYQAPGWDRYRNHPQMPEEIERKRDEVARRVRFYRGGLDYRLENKDVILCDDGIATGSTVMAILRWLPASRPRRIILAIPVMPRDVFRSMREFKIVSLETPSEFFSVGQFYRRFEQADDEQVVSILRSYRS